MTRLHLILAVTCFQFAIAAAPALAQLAEGELTWAAIERRIEQADAEGLQVLEAQLKQLPADAIEPSGDIKFASMIGDRYAELSMPELAVERYQQEIAIPHSQERGEESCGCANMWSVAMVSLLWHYYEHDQEAKILPTLEQAKDHSAVFSFQAQYHAMQIKWRAVLGDPAGSASRCKHFLGDSFAADLPALNSSIAAAIWYASKRPFEHGHSAKCRVQAASRLPRRT